MRRLYELNKEKESQNKTYQNNDVEVQMFRKEDVTY